jgi:hypothetical protein
MDYLCKHPSSKVFHFNLLICGWEGNSPIKYPGSNIHFVYLSN